MNLDLQKGVGYPPRNTSRLSMTEASSQFQTASHKLVDLVAGAQEIPEVRKGEVERRWVRSEGVD